MVSMMPIFIGHILSLPDSGRPTGMYKHAVSGSVELGPEGFVGDHQADRRVHGGPDKAVHCYPASHYVRLAERFPDAAGLLVPGSLGENLSSDTLDETRVRIGDTFRLGPALLQICQPRTPCWKIDERFGVEGMAQFIADNHLTGWYFRVLQGGIVDSLAELELHQAADAPTLAEAQRAWQAHRPAASALWRIADAPGIAAGWRAKLVARAEWLGRDPENTSAPPVTTFHVKPDR